MNIKTFDNFNELYQAFEQVLNNHTKNQDANIAIAGGSLNTIIKQLAISDKLVLANTVFWQVDERFVKRDSEFSNYKGFLEAMGSNKPFKYEYFDTEMMNYETENLNKSSAIEATLKDYVGRLEGWKVGGLEGGKVDNVEGWKAGFELCVLGVGPDGHVASLFPNSSVLDEKIKLVAHTQTDVFDVKDRLTLTFPPILASKEIVIIIQGKSKKEVFEKISKNELDFHDFPVNKLHEHSNVNLFFGDWE
ncbi:6-phosphogluconolactonase [Candidatus Dojkabacteria bacterium]|nr:6-phosphogluconolactonase [Candidatus Dojkabacteria bacterium]